MTAILEELISELLAKRPGEEFMLAYNGPGSWEAHFVNPLNCVALGETNGVFLGEGETATAAVQDCIEKERKEIRRF